MSHAAQKEANLFACLATDKTAQVTAQSGPESKRDAKTSHIADLPLLIYEKNLILLLSTVVMALKAKFGIKGPASTHLGG